MVQINEFVDLLHQSQSPVITHLGRLFEEAKSSSKLVEKTRAFEKQKRDVERFITTRVEHYTREHLLSHNYSFVEPEGYHIRWHEECQRCNAVTDIAFEAFCRFFSKEEVMKFVKDFIRNEVPIWNPEELEEMERAHYNFAHSTIASLSICSAHPITKYSQKHIIGADGYNIPTNTPILLYVKNRKDFHAIYINNEDGSQVRTHARGWIFGKDFLIIRDSISFELFDDEDDSNKLCIVFVTLYEPLNSLIMSYDQMIVYNSGGVLFNNYESEPGKRTEFIWCYDEFPWLLYLAAYQIQRCWRRYKRRKMTRKMSHINTAIEQDPIRGSRGLAFQKWLQTAVSDEGMIIPSSGSMEDFIV